MIHRFFLSGSQGILGSIFPSPLLMYLSQSMDLWGACEIRKLNHHEILKNSPFMCMEERKLDIYVYVYI